MGEKTVQIVLTGVVYGRPGSIMELPDDQAAAIVEMGDGAYYAATAPTVPEVVELELEPEFVEAPAKKAAR